MIRRIVKDALKPGDYALRQVSMSYRAKKKYASELHYWRGELDHLRRWHEDGEIDWWGIPAPAPAKKRKVSDMWSVNAVMTMHQIRPSYLEELQVERDCFRGKRILEVGCGPLAPVLQFPDCIRHGLDPLVHQYLLSGWPLQHYDVRFVSAKGEAMPYRDSRFDAVISVNALDHVDDFRQVASEIQRVVKIGGQLYFEIEYHECRVNEPQKLNDSIVLESFGACSMRKVIERGKREMFQVIAERFDLMTSRFTHLTNEDRLVTWHGTRVR
jgi:SAM-dependent methyltransferase